MIEQSLLLKLSSPDLADNTTSRLRQEYQAYQRLFKAQPMLVQQYLGIKASSLVEAVVQGSMGSIVEWQSLKMQEYRYALLVFITRFFEVLGVRRPVRFEPPIEAGTYDEAVHSDHPEAPSLLAQYLEKEEKPKAGGKPKETAPGDEELPKL